MPRADEQNIKSRSLFKLTVTESFSAAHRICGYPGKCADLHGHNWVVEVTVAGRELDELGMLVDLRVLKDALKAVTERLDHKYLNELPEFVEAPNPTSENIAIYISDEFRSELSTKKIPPDICVRKVSVYEGPRSQVSLEFED